MDERLASVRRAARAKRGAEERYKAEVIAAYEELRDAPNVYAVIADAAGTSRQAIRQLVSRSDG